MYNISKEFSFCYGHRVWSQTLNKEFSLDTKCACRHLHGHEGKVIVHLQSKELTDGMVCDFKHLNWFKKWLDDTLDHKFIIDRHDPLFTSIIPNIPNNMFSDYFVYNGNQNYWSIILSENNHQKELYEGFVIVDFVPTSENLSKWLFTIIQEKMSQLDVTVSKVEFYETPKSKSEYISDI